MRMRMHMILDIYKNILSYQYKIFATLRSKKNKAREYKKYKRSTYYIYNLDLLLLLQMS